MEELMRDIVELFRAHEDAGEREVNGLLRRYNREAKAAKRAYAKKHLLPYYLSVKANHPEEWQSWHIDDALERRILKVLRMKPRRTSSGVATVTVITKPWICSSECLYCPNDIRMPKSYLADEPACQRAERNYFDPYLQVSSRLRVLSQMGHETDKVEIIILGGTWSDYPMSYQRWFMAELFRAANECGTKAGERSVQERIAFYEQVGLSSDATVLAREAETLQTKVDAGEISFNEAIAQRYFDSQTWRRIAEMQHATWSELEQRQEENETAEHRVVGLVVETRPDLITAASLLDLRHFGCTKVQMGIQSLDDDLLVRNGRRVSQDQIARAFELLRLFGMKIHIHFMANLLGATPDHDRQDFRLLVEDERFLPDEIKLYPCILVANSALYEYYLRGAWKPYGHEELVALLTDDVNATPPYVRISRMIRDISAKDIVAGNKRANLRQLVEDRSEMPIREIRHREIDRRPVANDELLLEEVSYKTTVSEEYFLQWVTQNDAIAGYLRLSLPNEQAVQDVDDLIDDAPIAPGEAMIREVHVYGTLAPLRSEDTSNVDTPDHAQHRGLGRALVARACELARSKGYHAINVISAVGTRPYYRKLGFEDNGLYQQRQL